MADITIREIQVEIAERVCRGELTTADELAEAYGVSFTQAVALLANPGFVSLVGNISKAGAMLTWHSKAIPRLQRMVSATDDKTSLAAMKMLGQVTDAIKGGGVEVNINLEALVEQTEKKVKSNYLKLPENVHNTIELEEYERILSDES